MRTFGGHSCKDRTAEFQALAERLAREGGASTSGAQENGGTHHPGSTAHKSEFISRAKRISAGITGTAEKLQRLSQLAKRTSMFDDPAVQINELTSLIKQDIQGLNGALTDLSTFQSRQANGNRQIASLSTNTVDDLRGRLKDTTASFRDVLTLRQENLKVHQGRRQLFSAAPESRPFPGTAAQPGLPNLLSRPAGGGVLHGRPAAPLFGSTSVRGSLQGGSSGGGGGGGGGGDVEAGASEQQPLLGDAAQQQQLALLAPQESYQSSRAVALQNVERTIHELGAIFQDLALMVQQQGEMALRIEDNVDGTLENVNQAQAQLLKYLNTISSNRWLILKVFMVLMAFLVLFLVFIA
ncbi:hypothetical protein WJX81_007141 [Elliptochloris bilobata]|uniref:t-SNARE coiled-coil homology domain-containing protein n=1 Tax=Elliptochloris bilobata TaxID=381761 RepID=A0AAW1S280_9CHLO